MAFSSKRAKTCTSITGLGLLAGLIIAVSYYVSGPNPDSQFLLTLLTPSVNLDETSKPTVRFRFVNQSGENVTVKQFDADYGCRITMLPPTADLTLADDEACEVECDLRVEHDFILPRTMSENVIPLSACPIIRNSRGKTIALPTKYFEQTFSHRVVASASVVRLASHPDPKDLITAVRSIAIRPVAGVDIEGIRLSNLEPDATHKLTCELKRMPDESIVVIVSVSHSDATEASLQKNELSSHLLIQTTRKGVKNSGFDVSIPVIVRRSWTTKAPHQS